MKCQFFLVLLFFAQLSRSQVGIVTTVAGGGASIADGIPATSAQLGGTNGLRLDSKGNYYFCQGSEVKKVDRYGVISTFAGGRTMGYSGDGGPATAALFNTTGYVAFDREDNMYVSDNGNGCIRRIDARTSIVTTIAGTGTIGVSGDGGPATAARTEGSVGIAVDTFGNIYIGGSKRIRKIDTRGIITTFAGDGTTAGFSETGDGGPATAAQIHNAWALTIAPDGNLYFYTAAIRKIDLSTGIISTIAGSTVLGWSGDGGPATAARIGVCSGIAADNFGNIYFSDRDNNVIRMVNSAGIIRTLAGNGLIGFTGDGGPATAAEFWSLRGMDLDSCGNIYICDNSNLRIRKVTFPTCHALDVPQVQAEVAAGSIVITPNPVGDELNVSIALPLRAMRVIDVNGRILQELPIEGRERITINAHGLAPGLYFLEAIGTNGTTIHQRFVKE